MCLLKIVCIFGMVATTNAVLPLNYYYSSNGNFDGICAQTPCSTLACPTGQFRSACGNWGAPATDAERASPGSCQSCSLKPLHSTYSSYPAGGTFSDATCPFTCDAGYVIGTGTYAGQCVATSCTNPSGASNLELVPGTSPNSTPNPCEVRCKAGYSGNLATNPTTCTICAPGTFAAAGSTSCSPCVPVLGIPQYSLNAGSSACTACLPCTTATSGKYMASCGGSSAGGCATCTN